MNMRRQLIYALGAGAFALPLSSLAQQPGKVWHIGFLDFGTQQSMVDSGRLAELIEGLRERGYVEGRNFVLQVHYADGNTDRLDKHAAELVQQKADLIFALGTVASHAAQRATAAIPIVAISSADPVSLGIATSLARPGSNVTGLTNGSDDTAQKQVEMLLLAALKLKLVAVITNPGNDSHTSRLLRVQAATRQTGKQVLPIGVRTPEEIERGFARMARERADAVIIFSDAYLFSQRMLIAALALKHRLPSIYPQAQYPEAGGLMSYGSDANDNFRRAAIFVDKILKGAKPGDIPFEQPTRYYFVINGKTANALGVKLNNELLVRADKVIE